MFKKSSVTIKDEQVFSSTIENGIYRSIVTDPTGHAKAVANVSTEKQPPVNQARVSLGSSTQSSAGVKIN